VECELIETVSDAPHAYRPTAKGNATAKGQICGVAQEDPSECASHATTPEGVARQHEGGMQSGGEDGDSLEYLTVEEAV
jgi:hypothetical protein